MYELTVLPGPSTLQDALKVRPEERGLVWHISAINLAAELMIGAEDREGRERGKELFIQLADPTIESLRRAGRWTLWSEVRIWHLAEEGKVPEAQGYRNIVEWVQDRGEAGWWYEGELPQLHGQTIRSYLRVFRFYALDWSLTLEELGELPFGKLRDGLALARTLEQEEKATYLEFMRSCPRETFREEFRRSRGEQSISSEGPGPASARRFYLEWDTGLLWASLREAETMRVGVMGKFGAVFMGEARLLVEKLRRQGLEAQTMSRDEVEDALLDFCILASIAVD